MITSRKIGQNIMLEMMNNGLSFEEMSSKSKYSINDLYRIVDGTLLLSSDDMKYIASLLGVAPDKIIIERSDDDYKSLLHCMGTYQKEENKDKILEYMDVYALLSEGDKE